MDHTDHYSHAHRLLIEETRTVEAVRWTFPQPCIMLDVCIVTSVHLYVYPTLIQVKVGQASRHVI